MSNDNDNSPAGDMVAALRQELDTYRHAFETTAADRDRYKSEASSLARGVETLLSLVKRPSLVMPAPPPTAGRLLSHLTTRNHLRQGDTTILDSQRVPDVYCVGAPKSGTSFIYSILRQHPDVSVANKDTGGLIFLADSIAQNTIVDDQYAKLKTYLDGINNCNSSKPVLCDFDVGALIWPEVCDLISKYLNPDARILILLRDPVERAISQYALRVRQYNVAKFPDSFVETLSFWDAINSEQAREKKSLLAYRLYTAYLGMSCYYQMVERYLKAFGRERVKVIVFEEEILTNLGATILGCFEFLGLVDVPAIRLAGADHEFYANISRRPDRITVAFYGPEGERLEGQQLKNLYPGLVKKIEIKSDIAGQGEAIIESPSADVLLAAETLVERHALVLSPEEKRGLYNRYFRDDVERLERLLGRDLSVWYRKYN